MGDLRKCGKCKLRKPLDGFYRDARMPLGRRYVCKKCSGMSYAKWQKKNPEKIRVLNKKAYSRFKGTIEYKYWRTKATAKQRGIVFNLSFDIFKSIVQMPCFYCGSLGINGIDRIDSSQGYLSSNATSACYRCNVAKNTMTQEEFFTLCEIITMKNEHRYTL